MSAWKLKEGDYYSASFIAIDEFEGVPVVVIKTGGYPKIVNDAGQDIRNVTPHIEISINKAFPTENSERTDKLTASIHAVGLYTNGYLRELPVAKSVAGENLGDLLARARDLYPKTIEILSTMDAKYEAWDDIMQRLHALPHPFDRAAYEASCQQFGIAPRDESDLANPKYSEIYGQFTFPKYSLADLPRLNIDKYYIAYLRQKAKESALVARKQKEADGMAAIAEAKARPVETTYDQMVPEGSRAAAWFLDGRLHEVISTRKGKVIDEDDPSIHGSQLLGHEGERSIILTIAVHAAA